MIDRQTSLLILSGSIIIVAILVFVSWMSVNSSNQQRELDRQFDAKQRELDRQFNAEQRELDRQIHREKLARERELQEP